MGTEAMKTMKEQLMACVQGQMGDLQNVDAKELGEVMDMIKDLSEAIYYCTITESMEKAEKRDESQVNNINYYTTPINNRMMYPEYYRDMERTNGYMYYPSGSNSSNGGSSGSQGGGQTTRAYYTEMPYEMMRDPREGRAAIRRRMYMEGKEMHKDTKSQLEELEAYLQQLSTDITEMIKDASPEEKATLRQKMSTLSSKIA